MRGKTMEHEDLVEFFENNFKELAEVFRQSMMDSACSEEQNCD
jgi:hypothetical protein